MDVANLPARAQARLDRGRAMAEALFLDTCRITRDPDPADPGTFDEDTMQYVDQAPVVVYEGPCKFQIHNALPAAEQVAGQNLAQVQPTLHLPIEGSGYRLDPSDLAGQRYPRRGDIVECLTSAVDPALKGTRITVQRPHRKTLATARRLVCAEGV